LSILLLNTEVEYADFAEHQQIDYMHTIGPRLTYKAGKLSLNAATYFQTGKKLDKNVSALYVGGGLNFK